MATTVSITSYRDRLAADPAFAWKEADMQFDERSGPYQSLRRITSRLNELRIPCAAVGGLAMFQHGYRRFTEDVDLLVTAERLRAVHEHLEGLGWVRVYAGSKKLRDTQNGVQIVFLVAGQSPGDGKPKPVAFPDPAGDVVEIDGIRYLALPRILELKLASGLSSLSREKDLADVTELIKAIKLPRSVGDGLDPSVRQAFYDRWDRVHSETDPVEE